MTAGGVLPFSAEASDQALAALRAHQLRLQQLDDQTKQLSTDAAIQQRQVETQLPDLLRNVLNNFASRGMARSSGYGVAQGDVRNRVSGAVSDILAQLAQGKSKIERGRADSYAGYNDQLAQIQRAAARQISDSQAGRLHLNALNDLAGMQLSNFDLSALNGLGGRR